MREIVNDNDSIVPRTATSPGPDRQVLKLICLTHILHRDQHSTSTLRRLRLVENVKFSQPCGHQGRDRGFYQTTTRVGWDLALGLPMLVRGGISH